MGERITRRWSWERPLCLSLIVSPPPSAWCLLVIGFACAENDDAEGAEGEKYFFHYGLFNTFYRFECLDFQEVVAKIVDVFGAIDIYVESAKKDSVGSVDVDVFDVDGIIVADDLYDLFE